MVRRSHKFAELQLGSEDMRMRGGKRSQNLYTDVHQGLPLAEKGHVLAESNRINMSVLMALARAANLDPKQSMRLMWNRD